MVSENFSENLQGTAISIKKVVKLLKNVFYKMNKALLNVDFPTIGNSCFNGQSDGLVFGNNMIVLLYTAFTFIYVYHVSIPEF